MLTQADAEGFSLMLMKEIIDHRKDDSVVIPKSDMYVVTSRGGKKCRKTTIGRSLIVKWADDSEIWIPLKYLKESNPYEVAGFARA